jgi:enoyl-[acyl-carrier protein] reductase I
MGDLSGKHGLVVGVANKRSISWAVAQAAGAAGARLALTYQGERLEENVRDLSEKLDSPLIMPLDVTNDQQIADVVTAIDREFGGLDFLLHGAAFAPKAELDNPFVETSREGFRIALDVSAYSLISLTRAVLPLMERRGGGSVVTLTYLGSQRGGREGCARGLGPVSGERSRRQERSRERDIGRPDQDARRDGHLRLLGHPACLSRPLADAPQHRRR